VTYPELIQSTGGGILYSPHTAAGLAEALDSALSNPARLRQLGETGRKSVFEHYSDDVMAQNVVRAVSRIVPTFNEAASKSTHAAGRP